MICRLFFALVIMFYLLFSCLFVCFFFKQKTAYEMRISDWSSDVCSSDLASAACQLRLRSWATPSALQARHSEPSAFVAADRWPSASLMRIIRIEEIGRASCRERVCQYV